MLTIDMDSGGTFTDATLTDGSRRISVKIPTTPHDLTICFRRTLEALAGSLDTDVEDVLARTGVLRFSTTVGTNAVIEGTGPRLGLLVDARRADHVSSMDPTVVPGMLLPPSGAIVGVSAHAGRAAIVEAVEKLLAGGAERLVIAADDSDRPARAVESHLRDLVLESYPRHILGAVPVSLSTDVAGDDTFDRRLRTAVLNAYLHPTLEQFLYETEEILRRRGMRRPLLVFGNDGTSNRVTKVTALRTYNSGPVGGVEAVASFAQRYELAYAVGVDIGGTSSDLSFVAGGRPESDKRGLVAGSHGTTEVSLPMRRVRALSGGGGTIARPVGDNVKLGPDSAGGAPGPACFGFGGTDATVTDADIVLGRLAPDAVLAGEIHIDPERAVRAVSTQIGDKLGLSAEAAALVVVERLEQMIARAVVEGVTERSLPLDQFTLIAFGGAGPAHAAGIAAAAGISRVLVPGNAGVLSTVGIGVSDVEHRYERAVPVHEMEITADSIAARAYTDMAGEGFDAERVELSWSISLLDAGGSVLAEVSDPKSSDATRVAVSTARIELTALGLLEHNTLMEIPRDDHDVRPLADRRATWNGIGTVATPVYASDALTRSRAGLSGPILVEGPTLTLAVPPGWHLEADALGNFLLTSES